MKIMKLLDTNMILRFLLNDNEEMNERVTEIIKSESVKITTEVVAEVVYVLRSVYKLERSKIADAVIEFLNIPSVYADNYTVIESGLRKYGEVSLDFVDCLLVAYHTEQGYEICTFDKKLIKQIDKTDC